MNDIPRSIRRLDPSDRLAAEAQRLEEIKARSAIPAECGDAIPSAPGRGAFVMFVPRRAVQTPAGPRVIRDVDERGRALPNGIRVGDAFDQMQGQSLRARRSRKSDDPVEPLFTQAQLTAGREYATLFERYSAAGARCSSLETLRSSSGGSGGSFIDAVIRDGERLDRMRRAIGDGWAMEPRRAAPHGDRRRAIRIADLVHRVCIDGKTISQVLRHFGWATGLKNSGPLMACLRGALDRMYDADRR